MKPRERMMLILVGVAAVIFGGKSVVQFYTGALADLDKKIKGAKADLAKAGKAKIDLELAKQDWKKIGSQTLSMDVADAKNRLRQELYELAERCRLDKPVVDLGQATNWLKNGLSVLNCGLTAEGTSEDISRFLFNLHREQVAVRCQNLTLTQVDKKKNDGRLKIVARLDTLILPTTEMVPAIVPAELPQEVAKRKSVSRPAGGDMNFYSVLWDRQLFQPYTPPVVVQKKPEATTKPVEVAKTDSRPPPPPPPPPPPDQDLVITRLLSSPLGQQVVLEDLKKPNSPEIRKMVGEDVYGGTLVFVHPKGAVTEKDGLWRFHALGQPLKSCKPLTDQEQPLILEELMKLQEQSAGITEGPNSAG